MLDTYRALLSLPGPMPIHNVASTASGIELIHALTSRDILRLCPEQPPLPASPMDTNSTLPTVPSPVRLIHSGQFSPYPKVASCCVAGNVRHATIQHPSHSLSPTPPHTEGGGSISPQAHVNYARNSRVNTELRTRTLHQSSQSSFTRPRFSGMLPVVCLRVSSPRWFRGSMAGLPPSPQLRPARRYS